MDALLVNPLNYSLELPRDELGPKPYILQEFASDTMCLFRFGVATRSGGGTAEVRQADKQVALPSRLLIETGRLKE